MGMGPVPAVRLALSRAGLAVDDIDLFELNEAFAAQSVAVSRELALDAAKVNVHGGAIALGHPIGASGARVLTTLLYALRARKRRYGVGLALHRRRHGHRDGGRGAAAEVICLTSHMRWTIRRYRQRMRADAETPAAGVLRHPARPRRSRSLESGARANLADDPDRFLLDPRGSHRRARRTSARAGFDVVGFYHSHPHSPPCRPRRDIAEAAYPGSLYPIVSLEDDAAGRASIRLTRISFERVAVDVVDTPVDRSTRRRRRRVRLAGAGA